MRFVMRFSTVLVLLFVAGCGTINLVAEKSVDPLMESFVRAAAEQTGTEITKMDENDPWAYAWDDVSFEELPDHQRAAKELQRAKYFSIELRVENELWNVSYRQYGDEWMLNNVSTALINPRTEILFPTARLGKLANLSVHPVFKHFIPPRHHNAKKNHDAIYKRSKNKRAAD